jgi:hypothetical protein
MVEQRLESLANFARAGRFVMAGMRPRERRLSCVDDGLALVRQELRRLRLSSLLVAGGLSLDRSRLLGSFSSLHGRL